MMPRTRRPRRIRPARFPLSIERQFVASRTALVRAQWELYEQLLFPRLGELQRLAGIRGDAARLDQSPWRALLRQILQDVGQRYSRIEGFAIEDAEQAGAQLNMFNRREFERQMRAAVGVDVFAEAPELVDLLEDFAERSAAHIKNSSETINSTVSNIVTDGFRSGQRASDVGDAIERALGVAQSRAQFWARDIIGTLSGQMARARQTNLGIEEYIWRTSRDERVRASHRELEGTKHSWDDPPTVGQRQVHPGEDYNCRCTPDPVIPGVENIKTEPWTPTEADKELVRRRRNRDRRRRERNRRRSLSQPSGVSL